MSDDDVTQLETCLDEVGRSFVVDYTKSQRRRRKDKFHLCRLRYTYVPLTRNALHLSCLDGAVVERPTRDRKVAGSTPGRGAIK